MDNQSVICMVMNSGVDRRSSDNSQILGFDNHVCILLLTDKPSDEMVSQYL